MIETSPSGRPVVLVVDDEDEIRQLFAAALTTAGFDVLEAADGEQALERLARAEVSLMLLDTSMPRLDGLAVIQRVRANEATARLPIVLVTGAGAEEDRVRGLDTGADDYLAKPVSLAELVARARAHVRAFESWRMTLRRSLEIRRGVSVLLQRVPRTGTPAQTAARAIAELAELIGVDAVALLLPSAGRYRAYASHGSLSATYPTGSYLPTAISRRLAARAAEGYWVQPVQGLPDHAIAHFPFAIAGGGYGLFVVSDRAEGPMAQRILSRLADLAEVAELVGGFLAPIAELGAAEVILRAQVERWVHDRAFTPHFQPIVRLEDEAIVAFEALTRFDDGRAPDSHFADARRVGLGPELELATLSAAIRASARLPVDARLHVNVSPARILDTDLLPALLARAPRQVVIELTEHEAIVDYDELRDGIAALPNVEVAVDDAGSGYASLRHIQALRPNSVKLDLTWVQAAATDAAIRALVGGLVQFGRTMGCAIIGEGVETAEHAKALADLGVGFGQGYRFGRPAPVDHWATARA